MKVQKTIETKANARAMAIAINKLNESQQWIQSEAKRLQLKKERSQQFKTNLIYFARWVGSGLSGWAIYLGSFITALSIGYASGINSPSAIACPSDKSWCYLLRLTKETVIITPPPKTEQQQKK